MSDGNGNGRLEVVPVAGRIGAAINDYGDRHRLVRRVTVDGVAPVSVDGRRSRTRSKTRKLPAAERHATAAAASA